MGKVCMATVHRVPDFGLLETAELQRLLLMATAARLLQVAPHILTRHEEKMLGISQSERMKMKDHCGTAVR